ncbi:MAG: polyisoprenoid-binding protein YceI [Cyclobacteriaceae bacterium]|jgi:polyisoprenoid-binding protein YceI
MKNGILIFMIVIGVFGQTIAQSPLIDRDGTATFFSEAPIENIEATNSKVLGAIDLEKGTLAVAMFIKGFHFDKSLMEEHFNENYLESDKFPKATFKGTFNDFSNLDFSKSGSFEAEVEGEIAVHGVTKPLKATVKFDISKSKMVASTTFDLTVADFDIEIPKLLFTNIAEVVEVKALFNFSL